MTNSDNHELWVCSCEALHQIIDCHIGRCCCQHLHTSCQVKRGQQNGKLCYELYMK